MGAEAPQWLFNSFVDALQEIGATASRPECEAEARDLIARWSAPERTAHSFRHLINVLAHIDELSASVHDPDVLRVAAWYHGAVLDRTPCTARDALDPSTTASNCPDLTRERLEKLGVSEDVILRVLELIDNIARHEAARDDTDAQVLVDADLARLADSPRDFKKYCENLREEYCAIDDLTYYTARRNAIRRLLARETVFHTTAAQEWEDTARANLEVELLRLHERIRSLDPDADIDEPAEADEPIIPVEKRTTSTSAADPAAKSDEDAPAVETVIIKRKQLKKNQATPAEDVPTSTGVLPTLAPLEEEPPAPTGGDDDDASSLETAIDSLNVP